MSTPIDERVYVVPTMWNAHTSMITTEGWINYNIWKVVTSM